MESDLSQIGYRREWDTEKPIGIGIQDRRHHLYLIGKSGSGKTTLLRNLLIQDIEYGRGIGLIDPHGDLASELLDFIPPSRIGHVINFDPADQCFPMGLNLFRLSTRENWHLVASGIVSAFKNVWHDSWGPRLEYILYATIAALAHCENSSLLGVQRMLSDEGYRAWVVRQIEDVMLRSFWEHEFARYDKRFLQETISPIQNKVGQLFLSPILRNVLGQVRNTCDFRFVMDNKRIFIANLSKGKIGGDKSNLMGSLLVTAFELAALSRSDVREADRQDFQLYIDEFQNFSTDSFASILSEARKFRLCLTLAHQYIDQIDEGIRNAVFGNVGSLISFRVGNTDAQFLEREFGDSSAEYLTNLANHEICLKLLQEGQQSAPFGGRTLPPLNQRYSCRETIIKSSRQRYTRPCAEVEDKLRRWLSA